MKFEKDQCFFLFLFHGIFLSFLLGIFSFCWWVDDLCVEELRSPQFLLWSFVMCIEGQSSFLCNHIGGFVSNCLVEFVKVLLMEVAVCFIMKCH